MLKIGPEWEKFKGGQFRTGKKVPHVTLNEKGQFYISQSLYNLMGRPSAVALYYNRKKGLIAMQPFSVKRADSFPVVEKRNGAHWINAALFCRHYKIRFFTSHKFLEPKVTEERMVILDLQNTTPIFHKSQLKKTKPAPPLRHSPEVDALMEEFRAEDEDDDI